MKTKLSGNALIAVIGFMMVYYTITGVFADLALMLNLLLPLTGRGKVTALIALVSYTLLIIFRNVITGLNSVPAEARDAGAELRVEEYRRLEAVDRGQAAVDRVWAGNDRDRAAADRAELRDIGGDATDDPKAQE